MYLCVSVMHVCMQVCLLCLTCGERVMKCWSHISRVCARARGCERADGFNHVGESQSVSTFSCMYMCTNAADCDRISSTRTGTASCVCVCVCVCLSVYFHTCAPPPPPPPPPYHTQHTTHTHVQVLRSLPPWHARPGHEDLDSTATSSSDSPSVEAPAQVCWRCV